MLSQVSEKTMHRVRWVLVIGWLILIFSLFYDPITPQLTDPNNLLSPFRDELINPNYCLKLQGECLPEKPYPIGTRIFWGMVVPSAILILLVFGHETWRRICPLYFLSQIPRALGLQPRLMIERNRWLVRNHFYLQFALLFVGINCRILFINSNRLVFGLFLLAIIFLAIVVVFLYGGRSWCHYVCPFGAVQTVFTGAGGLLGSNAHQLPPKSITQSMCRTADKTTGQEISTCVSCKSSCLDIDAERAYWNDLQKPGRKFLQYGYLGLVISYFIYYRLYAGNFDYYFSGAWTHEENQLATVWKPGFYFSNSTIALPKLFAVPLTLALGVILSYWICNKLEKAYRAYLKTCNPQISSELVTHRFFSVCTFLAFNAFFIYGGRPEILRLPVALQLVFNGFVVFVSTLWLVRTWGRSAEQYKKESLVNSFRRQLKKLPIDIEKFFEGRSLDELKSDELSVLVQVLPQFTQQDRLQVYKAVLQEALATERVVSAHSLEELKSLRQQLSINEEEHYAVLSELASEQPELFFQSPLQSSPMTQTVFRSSQKISAVEASTELRTRHRQNDNPS
ncbi:MAG: 4Fe-4S binding protein [Coleofasciculaceae cyanobacterium]